MHLEDSKVTLTFLAVCLLCLLCLTVSCLETDNLSGFRLSFPDYNATWTEFKLKYDKNYTSEAEEGHRFSIFVEYVKDLEKHNSKFGNGQTTYWKGINQFSDWTQTEFEALFPDAEGSAEDSNIPFAWHSAITSEAVPDYIDWRDKYFVTPVKDQEDYGTCYAFAVAGAVESLWAKRTNTRAVPLSKQQIVDCSTKWGNDGCEGGYISKGFQYLIDVGGLQTEKTYPYRGDVSECNFNKKEISASISSYTNITRGDENALKIAVATVGPVVVSLAATDELSGYGGGLYRDDSCSTTSLNHALLLVGYGIDKNGYEYWTIKNSWGPDWGESGYLRLARNRGNQCGVATNAVYPENDNPNSGKIKGGALSPWLLLLTALALLKFRC